MKRLGLVVLLLAVTADAGRFDRLNSRCQAGRSTRGLGCGDDFAFFELAPANGAGMGAACACAAITGAKGEAVTFTRTGNATCSRQGLATTGIANGDLVSCGANLPRVESSGGVLGLRVEGARTNEILRSQEIDNPAWISSAVGVAVPTVTANAAIAPDGTLTAERLEVPLTAGGQFSYRLQTGVVATQHTASIYVRGNGTSGTMHLWAGTTPNSCVLCSYVSGSWSRCSTTTPGSATHAIGFGNDSTNAVCVAAGPAASALDVFVWQGQLEGSAAYPTSPIPTVASSVTRNADVASLSVTPPHPVFSVAASVGLPSGWTSAGAYNLLVTVGSGSANYTLIGQTPVGSGCEEFTAATARSVGGTMTTSRVACSVAGPAGAVTGFINGSGLTPTTAGAMSTPYSAIRIGSFFTGTLQPDGIITRVCVDPDITRCR